MGRGSSVGREEEEPLVGWKPDRDLELWLLPVPPPPTPRSIHGNPKRICPSFARWQPMSDGPDGRIAAHNAYTHLASSSLPSRVERSLHTSTIFSLSKSFAIQVNFCVYPLLLLLLPLCPSRRRRTVLRGDFRVLPKMVLEVTSIKRWCGGR